MPIACVFVAIYLLALTAPALAEKAGDPAEIDRTHQACLDNASNVQAQLRCIDAAASAWDKVLNANYQAALTGLDDKNHKLLREAQRKWLHYRDADQAFCESDWRFGNAFEIKVFLAEAGMQIVKARAQTLSMYAPVTE